MQPVSRQRIGKHVPATKNTHTKVVTVGNGVFFLLGPCKVAVAKLMTVQVTKLLLLNKKRKTGMIRFAKPVLTEDLYIVEM
jgi:hypothetical protein